MRRTDVPGASVVLKVHSLDSIWARKFRLGDSHFMGADFSAYACRSHLNGCRARSTFLSL